MLERPAPWVGQTGFWVTTKPDSNRPLFESEVETMDATFLYDSAQTARFSEPGTSHPILDSLGTPSFEKALDIERISFGLNPLYSGDSPAASFADSLDLLKSASPLLTEKEKLLVLALAGERLGAGYDHSIPQNPVPFEHMFENAKDGRKNGGICLDIHAYLAEYAKALGFVHTASHQGEWVILNIKRSLKFHSGFFK